MEYFIIKYKYYQYNSGQGDNGNYIRKLEFSYKNEAFSVYQKFQKYLNKQLIGEDKKDLEYDYIPYSGYFTEAKLFFIQETELIFQGDQS